VPKKTRRKAAKIGSSRSRPDSLQYGGRYLVRGGKVQTIEGDWKPKQIVIVEFPTMQRALEWYHSPKYAEALKVRKKALSRDLIFVDGVSDTLGARTTGRASNSHPSSRESDAGLWT
jgi:uncharacterized protein (DUF1330 family)